MRSSRNTASVCRAGLPPHGTLERESATWGAMTARGVAHAMRTVARHGSFERGGKLPVCPFACSTNGVWLKPARAAMAAARYRLQNPHGWFRFGRGPAQPLLAFASIAATWRRMLSQPQQYRNVAVIEGACCPHGAMLLVLLVPKHAPFFFCPILLKPKSKLNTDSKVTRDQTV